MLLIILLYFLEAQHVSGTTMPIMMGIVVPETCWASKKYYYAGTTTFIIMMGIVVPETCWASKKYNKIISSI